MNLSDRKWKEFFIAGNEGVFDMSATSSGVDKNKLNMECGNIPYITRSNEVNGINLFVSDAQDKKWVIDSGNVITIGLDTQTVFYQPHKFYTGQNIQVLKFDKMNQSVAMFIVSMLKVQMKNFNWGGNGATLGRLCRTKIMLPIDSFGNPDFDFMSQYICEIQEKKRNAYKEYCKSQLSKLGDAVNIKPISAIEWKPYRINKIAEVDSGKDIYDADRIKGDLPYITAGVQNNGIGYFVGNMNKTITKNAISVSRNGAGVGSSFYHEYYALYSNDCRKVILNDYRSNKFVSLFITNQIMMQRKNYNYSRKMGTERLKKQMIMLPALNDDEPDYEYMEQYIKNLMIKKYTSYITYIENGFQ